MILIKNNFDLRELCAFVVNLFHDNPGEAKV